jgi:hypothetical protein
MSARRVPVVLLALVGLCALLLASTGAWAQATRESAVKAAFLYKFGAFIEWPAGTFTQPDQPLVIGVAGDDDVASDLEQLAAGRTLDGRPVQVRRLAETGSLAGVNILFVGQRREARLKETVAAVPPGVLIVSDQPNGLKLGSVINFMSEAGRVRFSASVGAADARNLKLSARLLEVAQAVEGRAR